MDRDSTDDSGTDGVAQDTEDHADGPGVIPVTGTTEIHFAEGSRAGTWDVRGEVESCRGCTVAFDGDFTASGGDVASDFSRQVVWFGDGTDDTDAGEYCGYGYFRGGVAGRYTYDACIRGHSYSGSGSITYW